jgi:hypothetical protein
MNVLVQYVTALVFSTLLLSPKLYEVVLSASVKEDENTLELVPGDDLMMI